jgi:hypothetical protein
MSGPRGEPDINVCFGVRCRRPVKALLLSRSGETVFGESGTLGNAVLGKLHERRTLSAYLPTRYPLETMAYSLHLGARSDMGWAVLAAFSNRNVPETRESGHRATSRHRGNPSLRKRIAILLRRDVQITQAPKTRSSAPCNSCKPRKTAPASRVNLARDKKLLPKPVQFLHGPKNCSRAPCIYCTEQKTAPECRAILTNRAGAVLRAM